MKRTFLFLLICLFVNTSYSQTYNFEFSISDFSIVENNGKHMINHPISFDVISNTCEPILPSCVKNILLPPNKRVSNYSVTYNIINWQNNIDLEAMPMMHPTDGNNYSDVPCSYDLTVYPDSIVRYGGLTTIDRYDYVSFVITPFWYDATNKSLSFVNQVTITIELSDSETNNGIPTQNRVIKQIVHNSNDVDLFYPQKSQRLSTQNIDYLIITRDSLKNSFEPLRIWKTQKGVYTKIITLDEIYSNYDDITPQLKIKRCIQDYYNNYGLNWVLLGGDDTIVPIIKIPMTLSGTSSNIPSDMFYGCFDGAFNWDANGNGIIGEWEDNIVFNQKINISRLPINNNQQIITYIDKLFDYELNPQIIDPSMLVCGNIIVNNNHQNYHPQTGYSDMHIKSNIFIDQYITPYWDGNIIRFYDTGTDFPGDENYDLTKENIITQLNNNYDFLHFATHGNTNSWVVEDGVFSSEDAETLINKKPIIIVTTACSTNAFDGDEPCLSEAFIRQPNGGAIAYLGSSRAGWSYSGFSTLGPSFTLSANFFEILFSNVSNHFSEIVKLVKSHLNSSVSPENWYYRWIILANNAIGDAELPIYTTTPNIFQNVIYERNGTNLTIYTGGIDSCTITVSNISNGGEYYSKHTNVSSATFNNVPENATFVISKENYIPYIREKDCHIFNKIINYHKVIEGCQHTQIGGMPLFVSPQTQQINNNTPILPEYNFNDSPMLNWKLKITSTGSLEVHNEGKVTIKDLSMDKGSELFIY